MSGRMRFRKTGTQRNITDYKKDLNIVLSIKSRLPVDFQNIKMTSSKVNPALYPRHHLH